MEKFTYYLEGREFELVTDHKAMVELKKKKEFGSKRILRWFERLEHFNFTVKYREGDNMVQSDALSRSVGIDHISDLDIDTIKEVMQMHVNKNHRKNIYQDVIKKGIKLSENKVREIIKGCEVCLRKDFKYDKTNKFVFTQDEGEIFGVDLMEVSKNERLVLGIDYFTRKLYGRVLKTKESNKVLKFLKDTYKFRSSKSY
jgi:hypothetical protein